MGRRAKPRLKQGWYVTDAGGGTTKLARATEGIVVAEKRLAEFLDTLTPKPGRAPARPEPGKIASESHTAGSVSLRQAYDLFMHHARTYYRLPSGRESAEVTAGFPLSFRELLDLAGELPAALVDKRLLKQARQLMIDAGLSRGVINQRVGRIQRAFRWLAEEEHIPDTVAASLSLVRPLPAHRSPAPETEDVKPVDAATVAATLPHLGEPWASMVRLQWCTGMRPGEVSGLKVSMLAPAGRMALSADFGDAHKMAYKGRSRRVLVGPAGVMVLAPWLFAALTHGRDAVFVARKQRGKGAGAASVRRDSYDGAVAAAAGRAGVPHWHPNQIRHAYLTRVRSRFGLEAAQVAGGHAQADVTQIYAEADLKLAAKVAREMG